MCVVCLNRTGADISSSTFYAALDDVFDSDCDASEHRYPIISES